MKNIKPRYEGKTNGVVRTIFGIESMISNNIFFNMSEGDIEGIIEDGYMEAISFMKDEHQFSLCDMDYNGNILRLIYDFSGDNIKCHFFVKDEFEVKDSNGKNV